MQEYLLWFERWGHIYRNWNDINRVSIIDNKFCLKMKTMIVKFVYLKKLLKVDKEEIIIWKETYTY